MAWPRNLSFWPASVSVKVMKSISQIALMACLALLVGCGTGPQARPTATMPPSPQASYSGPVRPVVIDTDMGNDDWMAILYLLNRPDVEVKAITVSGTGLAHCEPGTRNALRLLALAEHNAVPVACGRETPLVGDHAFPDEWRVGADNLSGLRLPEGPGDVSEKGAAELLLETVGASSGKATLLALGPLTNVAEAVQRSPSLTSNLEMVYIMGGAVDVPGNIASVGVGIDNDVAEWNIYVDPRAANIVLESGAPVTLVPLDATNHVPVDRAFYQRIEKNRASPEVEFIFSVLTQLGESIDAGGYYLWDAMAAAILTDETLASFETRNLSVVEGEGPESGRTRVTPGGPGVRVVLSADGPRFEQVFLDTLNSPAR
jgi:inosine-uridine nucleoside N-ribohydrolase